jgi:predicted GNAT family N-acyltransferase
MKTSKRVTRDAELKIAFSIREEVFVKEQGVPLADEFDEFDSLDADCEHVLVLPRRTRRNRQNSNGRWRR